MVEVGFEVVVVWGRKRDLKVELINIGCQCVLWRVEMGGGTGVVEGKLEEVLVVVGWFDEVVVEFTTLAEVDLGSVDVL